MKKDTFPAIVLLFGAFCLCPLVGQAQTASSLTLTAPNPVKVDVTVASGNFTVIPNGLYTGTVTPNDGGAGGSFSPAYLSWTNSLAAQTFTYTPVLWGSHIISITSSPSLTNPAGIPYLGMAQIGHSGNQPAGNQGPSLGGFNLFANGPWLQEMTRDISRDSVDPNSDSILSRFTGNPGLHIDFSTTTANGGNSTYGMPYNVVSGSQALVPYPIANMTYGSQSYPGPVPFPTNADSVTLEGWFTQDSLPSVPPNGYDRHILVAQRNDTTGGIEKLFEAYNVYWNSGQWYGDNLSIFNIATGYPMPESWTTSDAGGLAIMPLMLKYEEVASGDVGHAIRATFPGEVSGSHFTWPGRHAVSAGGEIGLQMGGRIRLKQSWYNANKANYTGQALVILNGMAKYGLINADLTGWDTGQGPYVEGNNDQRWDWTGATSAILTLQQVPISAFEVVYQHPGYLISGPTSGHVGQAVTFTVSKYPPDDQYFDMGIYLYDNGTICANSFNGACNIPLTDAQPTDTFTYTPPTIGLHVLSWDNGGDGYLDPPVINFNATGPAFSPAITKNSFAISIYPNPANQLVTISLPENQNGSVWEIIFYDILGNEVKTRNNLQENIQTIDISDLPKGIYTVSAISGSVNYKSKIVLN